MPVLLTREPGGTPGAEALRGLLLSEKITLVPLAETLLHVAARAEHVARVIRPALEGGIWVVCDRFADSTMAYQGWGQDMDRQRIAALAAMIGLVPDATIMLSVPPATAISRLRGRGGERDRYERMDAGFHARVAEGFRAIAAAEPARCALLEADAPPDAVHAAILRTSQLASLLAACAEQPAPGLDRPAPRPV